MYIHKKPSTSITVFLESIFSSQPARQAYYQTHANKGRAIINNLEMPGAGSSQHNILVPLQIWLQKLAFTASSKGRSAMGFSLKNESFAYRHSNFIAKNKNPLLTLGKEELQSLPNNCDDHLLGSTYKAEIKFKSRSEGTFTSSSKNKVLLGAARTEGAKRCLQMLFNLVAPSIHIFLLENKATGKRSWLINK